MSLALGTVPKMNSGPGLTRDLLIILKPKSPLRMLPQRTRTATPSETRFLMRTMKPMRRRASKSESLTIPRLKSPLRKPPQRKRRIKTPSGTLYLRKRTNSVPGIAQKMNSAPGLTREILTTLKLRLLLRKPPKRKQVVKSPSERS